MTVRFSTRAPNADYLGFEASPEAIVTAAKKAEESWEPARQGSLPQFTSRLRLDVAENLAAAFDLDLAVADRPRDPAGRLDQEPVADDQITFEAAAYLGLVDRCRALEQAALGNLDSAAVGQLGVDTAFDEQFVAGIDFA